MQVAQPPDQGWGAGESISGDSTPALDPFGVNGVGGVTDRVGAASGLNLVAGSVGRAEDGCTKFGGASAGWSATAGVLAARGGLAGDANGRDIGTVGGRRSGAVTSVVEGSAPAAGSLSIRSPTSRARAVFAAGITSVLGACAVGACSLTAGSAMSLTEVVGRLSATAGKTFSRIPGAPPCCTQSSYPPGYFSINLRISSMTLFSRTC